MAAISPTVDKQKMSLSGEKPLGTSFHRSRTIVRNFEDR